MKLVEGHGYFGEGKYKSRDENGNKTKCYNTWKHMLVRCYNKKFKEKYPTYNDVTICKEWLCFQNFAKWYEENYYEIEGEKMQLDKDILVKGNKIYSPETCVFVPQRINELFTKSNKVRGDYPIGVSYHKRDNILQVRCNVYDKLTNKKRIVNITRLPINRPFQAFTYYKSFKENYIKEVAEEYKDMIPKKLYEAMYRYEVEIND